MENQEQQHPAGEPVSRKTNEEIDSDDEGNLLIDGQPVGKEKTVPSDGPFSEDIPKGKNSLTEQDEHSEE